MAMNSMPVPIPSITIKFECLPLFEALGDLAVGDRCGTALGDIATRGAVHHTKNIVNILRTGSRSIEQSST